MRYTRTTAVLVLFTAIVLSGQSVGLGQLSGLSKAQEKFAQRLDKYRSSKSDRAALQKAEAEMNRARALEKQGKTAEAISAYSTALTYGERAEARHRLAVLYDKQGDFEKSAVHYQQALKQDPRNAEILCDRGYSYVLQARPTEAEEELRKAVKLKPKMARAHNNLGLVLAQQGRTDEALLEFAAAGCSHAEARTNLAYALVLAGNMFEAQKQLALAQQADASLKQAAELRTTINAMIASSAPQTAAELMGSQHFAPQAAQRPMTFSTPESSPTVARAPVVPAAPATQAPPSVEEQFAPAQVAVTRQKQVAEVPQVAGVPPLSEQPRRSRSDDPPAASSQPQGPIVARTGSVSASANADSSRAATASPPTAVAQSPVPVVTQRPSPAIAREETPTVAQQPKPVVEQTPPVVAAQRPSPVVTPPSATTTPQSPLPVVAQTRPSAEVQRSSPRPTPASTAIVATRTPTPLPQVTSAPATTPPQQQVSVDTAAPVVAALRNAMADQPHSTTTLPVGPQAAASQSASTQSRFDVPQRGEESAISSTVAPSQPTMSVGSGAVSPRPESQRSEIAILSTRDAIGAAPTTVLRSDYAPIRLPSPGNAAAKTNVPAAGEALRTATNPSPSTIRVIR